MKLKYPTCTSTLSYLQLLLLPQVNVTVGGEAQFGGQPIKWTGFPLALLLHLRRALTGGSRGSLVEACQQVEKRWFR